MFENETISEEKSFLLQYEKNADLRHRELIETLKYIGRTIEFLGRVIQEVS